jgi:hypothetical protein
MKSVIKEYEREKRLGYTGLDIVGSLTSQQPYMPPWPDMGIAELVLFDTVFLILLSSVTNKESSVEA